jgi:hypothetical protein
MKKIFKGILLFAFCFSFIGEIQAQVENYYDSLNPILSIYFKYNQFNELYIELKIKQANEISATKSLLSSLRIERATGSIKWINSTIPNTGFGISLIQNPNDLYTYTARIETGILPDLHTLKNPNYENISNFRWSYIENVKIIYFNNGNTLETPALQIFPKIGTVPSQLKLRFIKFPTYNCDTKKITMSFKTDPSAYNYQINNLTIIRGSSGNIVASITESIRETNGIVSIEISPAEQESINTSLTYKLSATSSVIDDQESLVVGFTNHEFRFQEERTFNIVRINDNDAKEDYLKEIHSNDNFSINLETSNAINEIGNFYILTIPNRSIRIEKSITDPIDKRKLKITISNLSQIEDNSITFFQFQYEGQNAARSIQLKKIETPQCSDLKTFFDNDIDKKLKISFILPQWVSSSSVKVITTDMGGTEFNKPASYIANIYSATFKISELGISSSPEQDYIKKEIKIEANGNICQSFELQFINEAKIDASLKTITDESQKKKPDQEKIKTALETIKGIAEKVGNTVSKDDFKSALDALCSKEKGTKLIGTISKISKWAVKMVPFVIGLL